MQEHKLWVSAATLALFLFLGSGCGSNNGVFTNVNGTWNASLADANGVPTFSFTTVLTQSGNAATTGVSNVTGTVTFTSVSPCFPGTVTENGSVTAGGNPNGVVSSSVQLQILSAPVGSSGSNTLVMQGTFTDANDISGNWSLTGPTSGCTSSGFFTMSRV